MELHLFHQNKKNHLAVVGVFIIEGSKNPFLELVWDNWPDNKKSPQTHIKDILLNAEALLPKSKKFYHYVGSLTTPPYTEGVEWFLMNKPIQASEEQILRFRSILKNGTNARPIQPLNNRKID
jgi:carbonic anhydrase